MSKKIGLHFRECNIGFQLGCSVDSFTVMVTLPESFVSST